MSTFLGLHSYRQWLTSTLPCSDQILQDLKDQFLDDDSDAGPALNSEERDVFETTFRALSGSISVQRPQSHKLPWYQPRKRALALKLPDGHCSEEALVNFLAKSSPNLASHIYDAGPILFEVLSYFSTVPFPVKSSSPLTSDALFRAWSYSLGENDGF